MMNNRFLLIACFFISFYPVSAQQLNRHGDQISDNDSRYKHSVNIEIGGRTLIIASLNYEYLIRDKVSIGAGWGLNSIDRGNIIRNNNGITETGDYFDIYSTVNFSGIYFIGEGKHKLLLTGGITHFWRHEKINYPSETIVSNESDTKWNAGVGYQFTRKRFYFRATAYCLALPQVSQYAPDYIPWLGLTLGYQF